MLVWNSSIRISLFQVQPVIETVANLLNDTLWLPIVAILPFYLAAAATKVTKFTVIKIIFFIAGFIIFILGILHPAHFFRYVIYLIIPYFTLVIYYIVTFKKLKLNIIIYSMVIAGLVLNYRLQLVPSFHIVDQQPQLKVLCYNILVTQYGRKRQDVIKMIRDTKADIVFLQEINIDDRKLFDQRLADIYPHQLWSERNEEYNGGVILSRLPFSFKENRDIQTKYMRGHINLNHAVVQVNDQDVHLFNFHLYNSGSYFIKLFFGRLSFSDLEEKAKEAFNRHQTEAAKIAEIILPIHDPVIIAGDFNDTPNSLTFKLFSTKLQNTYSKAGWGLGATFGYASLVKSVPPRLRFLLFDFLRIDHVFCSEHFKVRSAKVLDCDASDHRAQVAELEFLNK